MLENNITQSVQRLAYDLSGLHQLKRQVNEGSTQGIKQVAQQFESLLVNMMLQSMRKAVPEGGLLSHSSSSLFTSMFDQQIAQQAAGKGLGLAKMLLQQLTNNMNDSTLAYAASDPMTVNDMHHKQTNLVQHSLSLAQSLYTSSSTLTPKVLGQGLYHDLNAKPLAKHHSKALSALTSNNSVSDDLATKFIKAWITPAKQVAKSSGLPYQIIIAQAALETGWGQKQILTADGQPSYNYFGIKANAAWQGKTTYLTTTEYSESGMIKRKDHFKVYNNQNEALIDYTRLLTQNPRYQSVQQASNAIMAAQALQEANYATDPHYSKKLIQVIDRINNIANTIQQVTTSGFQPITTTYNKR